MAEDRKTKRTIRIRSEIMDAAIDIISEKGFNNSTTKEIAKTAGIAEGTIYNYFDNKSDILLSIAERYMSYKRSFDYSSDISSTEEFIKNNSIVVEKVVKALVEAEDFVKNNRDESINIMAKEIGISKSDAENLWSEIDLIVYLDQSLLLSLDEVARWMINNNLTDSTEVPNYLDYIYIDALEEVKPEAVTIIR